MRFDVIGPELDGPNIRVSQLPLPRAPVDHQPSGGAAALAVREPGSRDARRPRRDERGWARCDAGLFHLCAEQTGSEVNDIEK